MTRDQIIERVAEFALAYRLGKDGSTAEEFAAAIVDMLDIEALQSENERFLNGLLAIRRRMDLLETFDSEIHRIVEFALTDPQETKT